MDGLTAADLDVEALVHAVADPREDVLVHSAVHALVDRLLVALETPDPGPDDAGADGLDRVVVAMETGAETLTRVFAAAGYWSRSEDGEPWVSALERLVARPMVNVAGRNLHRYPACRCLYAAGVSAIARRRYPMLRSLLLGPLVEESRRDVDIASTLHAAAVLDVRLARTLLGLDRRKTPMSDRLFETLRPALALPIPDGARYERAFDEFEYLLGLVSLDRAGWGPPGRFSWKDGGDRDPGARMEADIEARGAEAGILASGLFRGSGDGFTTLRSRHAESLRGSGIGW